MKYTVLILLLFQIIALSCNQIELSDLQGRWSYAPGNGGDPMILEFVIMNDTIELIADGVFKEEGTVSVNGRSLDIRLKRDSLMVNLEIKSLQVDTLILSDSTRFYRNNYFGAYRSFDSYNLINISTGQLLTEGSYYYRVIHYYKDDNCELRIRCSDKMCEFRDIPLFLEARYRNPMKTVVFIGRDISLKNLKQLYLTLAMYGEFRVYLATKRVGISDMEIIEDRVEVWQDDIEGFRVSQKLMAPLPPPPPPVETRSKNDFLGSEGLEIRIDTQSDLGRLDSINEHDKYVVTVNDSLPLETYIQTKLSLQRIKKINKRIRTSIE